MHVGNPSDWKFSSYFKVHKWKAKIICDLLMQTILKFDQANQEKKI